jgi:hypothetical protein
MAQGQVLLVQPKYNTQYQLVLSWGWGGSQIYTNAEVAVRLPIDPIRRCKRWGCFDYIPDCSAFEPCHHTVKINANDLAPLLVQALGTPNTTVIVKDGVELNLTPHQGGPISIAGGVQLIGERMARLGTPYQPGPRLFVTFNRSWNLSNWPNPLFRIEGDNVRFSGVRLEGPGSPPDEWRAKVPPQGYTKAILVGDEDLGFFPINIEIDHNELYNWNTDAVDVRADCSPQPCDGRIWTGFTSMAWSDPSGITYPKWQGTDSEPIYIHDNYFHDNFYGDPYFGYGVGIGGSHALIERNVFDGHHHAIAGGNDHHTGYRVYRNLVLKNGDGRNQQFDMHGTTYCNEDDKNANHGKGTWHQECGYAGHDIDIRWNSFLWFNSGFTWEAPAIKVRGLPSLFWEFLRPVGIVVKSNVFNHEILNYAVVVNGTGLEDPPVVTVGSDLLIGNPRLWVDNQGADPDDNLLAASDASLSWDDDYHHSDACDFDGDQIPDRLITTGQTWWFRSGDTSRGPTPWVYLTTSTLLVRDVSLVPSSNGHGCDIYAR